jgi:peptide/nickel transport system substrate-binding protein
MREPEVRATALLNNEVQIAELTPLLVDRVKSAPNVDAKPGGALAIMFVAMNPLFKPWDNKLARQAVAYAIDRDAIINNILKGYAEKLEGPIGPGVYGYDPAVPKLRYTYDPNKAKELMAQAGYPNGIDVDNIASNGSLIADKEVNEAIGAMLTAVGLRMKITTPEPAKRTTDIESGQAPFYYQQRGSVRDPGGPLAQYIETGASKRLNYSNPKIDELFKKERATFDEVERKKVLAELVELIQEEVPMYFLWRHKPIFGVAKSIDYTPRQDEGFYPSTIRMK